jgi:GNAT superfamily N-acetyltransferase
MLSIREITPEDAEPAAQLSGELGYPVATHEMEQRIRNLGVLTNHVVYVACEQERVVGWIDVAISHHLVVEPFGEICALVVANSVRNKGIGSSLVSKAEQWVCNNRINQITVRSSVAREQAHRFYLREGYQRTKTSGVFTKSLVFSSLPHVSQRSVQGQT